MSPSIWKAKIRAARAIGNTLVALQVEGAGRPILEVVVRHPRLRDVKLVTVVSPDVALHDDVSLLWGMFTRFDPARDCACPGCGSGVGSRGRTD